MLFFVLSKVDHFGIFLIMMNFDDVPSFTEVGYSVSLDENEVILEFLLR